MRRGTLKKRIQLITLLLVILVAGSFIMGIVFSVEVKNIFSLKENISAYLRVVENKVIPPSLEGKLISDLLHFPLINQQDVEKLKIKMGEMRTSGHYSTSFISDYVESLELKSLYRLNEIYFFVLLGLLGPSVVIGIILYISFGRHFLSDINAVSDRLSHFDLFNFSPLERKKDSYREARHLIDGFNEMASHVDLIRLILEEYMKSNEIHDFAERVYKRLKEVFNVNRFVLERLLDNKKLVVDIVISDSKKIIINEGFTYDVDESFIKEVRDKKIFVLNDIGAYLKRHSNVLLSFLKEGGINSTIIIPFSVPLYSNEEKLKREEGIVSLSSFKKNAFDDSAAQNIYYIANILNYLHGKMLTIHNLTLSMMRAFTEMVEKKDEETGGHLERMALYSLEIAKEMAKNPKYSKVLTPLFIDQIYKQAPLHDIGKVNVPDNILRKPGKLEDWEFEVMKTHTVAGYEIIDHIEKQTRMETLKIGKRIIRHHHERWDGKGYPDGLKGKEIPICARIVAVADVFDALTSKRPYKGAMDYETSVRIILEEKGTHFDPDVVDAFIKAKDAIKRLYDEFQRNSSCCA